MTVVICFYYLEDLHFILGPRYTSYIHGSKPSAPRVDWCFFWGRRVHQQLSRACSAIMNQGSPLEYPLNAPSYIPALDDGPWVQQELQQETKTWRSEKWPPQSNVLILDYAKGVSTIEYYDDAGITTLLEGPDPQVRFILLAPTN